MDKLGIAGTVRMSLGVYNDRDDVDHLAAAVEACREMFLR
jgi:selenocysteine lyase/cysteine desulfurase